MWPQFSPRNPSSLLPLLELGDDVLVTTSGAYATGFRLTGIDTEHLPESEIDIAREHFDDALKALPEGARFQILLSSSVDTAVTKLYNKISPPGLLEEQTRRRTKFLTSRQLRKLELFLFVSTPPARPKDLLLPSQAMHERQAAILKERVRGVLAPFERLGCHVVPLVKRKVWQLLWAFTGHMEPPYPRDEPNAWWGVSVREQLLKDNIRYSPEAVEIGASAFQVLSLKGLSKDSSRFTDGEQYLSLPFPFRLTFHVAVPDQRRKRGLLAQGKRFAHAQATQGKYVQDEEKVAGFKEASALAELLAETGQRLVHIGAQLIVWGETTKDADARAEAAKEHLAEKGLLFVRETGRHDRELFKSAPGMGQDFDRWLQVTSSVLGDLLPVMTLPQGDTRPTILFERPHGTAFAFDPFAPYKTPKNMVIVGATGAGKSVMTNLLILEAMLKRKAPVVVLDVAGEERSSYLRLTEVFGGTFIPLLAKSRDIALNPLLAPELVTHGGRLDGEALAFMTEFVDLLLSNQETGMNRELYRGLLRRAIEAAYRGRAPGDAPLLSDVYAALQNLKEKEGDASRASILSRLLLDFLEGPWAQLFNRPTKGLGLDEPFVVLDLFGVERLPENLQAAVTLLVIFVVERRAFALGGARYVVLDEVGQLLKIEGGALAALIEGLYSTLRKHGGAVITVTQRWESYRQAGLAVSLAINSGNLLFLSHAMAENARELVIKDFEMNAREAHLFRHLETIPGKKSEGLLRTTVLGPNYRPRPLVAKVVLTLSPFDLALFTTTHEERTEQDALIKANPDRSVADVLAYWAEKAEARGRRIP